VNLRIFLVWDGVVFRDSICNWDFCVFFFLLFFIFRHRSLFFCIFYDYFIPSALLVHISGVIIISLLVCSVYVESHRTWSTVSPASQKGHCGSNDSVHL
jgi:hypothetical protein